ncbi:hypothetical protein, partial [Pseudomonas syringae]
FRLFMHLPRRLLEPSRWWRVLPVRTLHEIPNGKIRRRPVLHLPHRKFQRAVDNVEPTVEKQSLIAWAAV